MAGDNPGEKAGLPLACAAGDPPADSAIAGRAERSLEEIVEGNFRDVSREEWNRLPHDLTDRLDHYLYGTGRWNEGSRGG